MDTLIEAGFDVTARGDHASMEQIQEQGQLDLVVLVLEPDTSQTGSYCDQLRNEYPRLPILVIGDDPGGWGIHGLVNAQRLYEQVAFVLTGSNRVRQVLPPLIPSVWHGVE